MEDNYTYDESEAFYMGERELTILKRRFKDYVENVVKNETNEQSRKALIKTGVLTRNGNVKKELSLSAHELRLPAKIKLHH